MHDKIIHNPKICLELRGQSVAPFNPWLFIDPLDGPIDPWGSISTTLRTTVLVRILWFFKQYVYFESTKRSCYCCVNMVTSSTHNS